MNNLDLIKSAVKASDILKHVDFPDLVYATSGFRVKPLNEGYELDKELITSLTKAANHLIEICNRTRRRFQGNRVNEVGNAIEEEFVQELRTTELKPVLLREKGYPDMELVDNNGRKTYLESKATSQNWDDTFRSFYYSNGRKIDTDARHILIGWKLEEERDKYWKIGGWRLVDLYYLKLRLKSEFNASNKDVYIKAGILRQR